MDMRHAAFVALAAHANALALPQVNVLGLPSGEVPSLPIVTGISLPTLPGAASLPGLSGIPALPSIGLAALPLPPLGGLPGLPATGLPIGGLPGLPGVLPGVGPLPVVAAPSPPSGKTGGSDSDSSTPLPLQVSGDALDSVTKLGSAALSSLLDILDKGLGNYHFPSLGNGRVSTPAAPSFPTLSTPLNASVPVKGRFARRQLLGLPGLTSGTTGTTTSPLTGLTSAISGVTAPLASSLGGLTGSTTSPLTGVTSALSGVTAPLASSLGGLTSGLTGGLTGSTTSPLTGVTSALSGVTAPLTGTLGGLTGSSTSPVLGSAPSVGSTAPSASASSSTLLTGTPLSGIPGTDPVGAFSISVIATLLSLLKKDPLSLFAPALPIPQLVKRDLPELHKRGIPELAKRQGISSLSAGIPLLSSGVGAQPGSGISGISPDLSYLVGTIARNLALPNGQGLGSITSSILNILNGVVPNFIFQLPVVQDSVPTFGVLQLLSTINPTKFGVLNSLTSLATLNQAVAGLNARDITFLRTLPLPADPTNLMATIQQFSDNLLSLPGNVLNLRASAAALALRNLGLTVQGF